MKKFTKLFAIMLLFLSLSAHAQYCMLPGRTTYSDLQPGITNFKLNTINRTSGNVEKPLNLPSLVVTSDSTVLERGKTYTVTILHTRDSMFFPTARNNIRMWIDYNKNFSWEDAGETVVSSDLQSVGTFTATFTVPMTAPLGTTWLRATAKMSADAGHTFPTSCDNPADPLDYHGEMEDYKVTIVMPTGIDDVKTSQFSIYPNPSNGIITVAFNGISNQPMNIELFDVTGKKLSTLLNIKNQSATAYQLDMTDKTSNGGVYFIKVSSGNNTSYQKFVRIN